MVAVVGLAVGAHHGNAVAQVQLKPFTVSQARLDDAFYHCIDVQARSLVSPDQPIALSTTNFGNYIELVKGVGSWATLADPPGRAVAKLSLRSVSSPGACLGSVVVATYRHPGGGTTVRVGSGASVPGTGPPPALPL